ncbi:metal-dependent hydrolase [Thermincola potens]|uniref:Membrane-bound metal-dependent hydrolase n=1 Tax=Thermincola potens (strain JR) TaxID=635013 RepID=D5XBI6_THEPJ|nr:metal-dependent hydrolase [Thermincola potens]ADG83415.1 membrane-bound metal-dependent hydrolase [Thermincola potens JR]
MDPVTHFLVGTVIAGVSGEKLSVSDPVYLSTVLGSLMPDMDIVYQLRGHIAYLKNHRGMSHSVPGLICNAGLIALAVYLLAGYRFVALFAWALLGGLSHVFLDVLNSYGAQVLWPLSKKKYSLNLLVLFDPVLAGLCLAALFWRGSFPRVSLVILVLTVIYLLFRLYMRHSVFLFLSEQYREQDIERIIVMPAMVSLWDWSFLVETRNKYIVGEAKWLSFETGIRRVLEKVPHNHIIQKALYSKIGRLFQSFTPYYHIHYYQDGENHVVCFADLRYFVRDDFLHNAKVVLSRECEIAEAVFQPYSKKHNLSF